VVCPVYSFTAQPFPFFPGLGGSGFDLLHLDPRSIDLFDNVLDGGALQMKGLGFLFWRVLEDKGLGPPRGAFLS
jgi:hypothetical protein